MSSRSWLKHRSSIATHNFHLQIRCHEILVQRQFKGELFTKCLELVELRFLIVAIKVPPVSMICFKGLGYVVLRD